MASTSALVLRRQLQGARLILVTYRSGLPFLSGHPDPLRKHPVDGFSAGLADDDNVYEWDITIFGPTDTLYEGGFLKARMSFPQEFPLRPPKFKFLTPMWHPNASASPSYTSQERTNGATKMQILSVISMLSADTPDTNSPANVDAAKQVREDLPGFKKKVRRLVRQSAEEAF
ncbi:MAG: hypothetical protein CYPHOPRED_005815 [Cyphobasidiales sp. Tagirdzhanova-0007]|nr:MAG: hypothetical protein CYPHOPRED_005815 [Cyphobasidiales sp. Tagirdzhanova-0007]